MRPFILALLLIHLCACTSMHAVSVHDLADSETPAEIQAGDRVEVITNESEKLIFNVTEVNAYGVSGQFGFIRFDDIRRIRVERPGSDSGENLTWLWAVLGAAAAIALIASADSVAVCSPSPCPSPE